MMTWFPNMSLFDAAEALELPEMALSFDHVEVLFNTLIYGPVDSPWGEPPLPLTRMWIGYEAALAAYGAALGASLVRHGIHVGVRHIEMANSLQDLRTHGDPAPLVMPPWLSDLDVLRSHRSNMMRRWPDRYSWKGTPPLMPYIWPIVDDEGGYQLKLSKHDRGLIASGDRKLPTSLKELLE